MELLLGTAIGVTADSRDATDQEEVQLIVDTADTGDVTDHEEVQLLVDTADTGDDSEQEVVELLAGIGKTTTDVVLVQLLHGADEIGLTGDDVDVASTGVTYSVETTVAGVGFPIYTVNLTYLLQRGTS